jgi:hypothetical protein
MSWIEECPSCKRPFSVTTSGDYPFRDRESVFCPHCKTECYTKLVRFDYETAPLTPEQEQEYRAGKLNRGSR